MRTFKRMLAGIGGMAIAWSAPLVSTATAQDGVDFNEAERMMSFNVVELREQLYFGLRTIPEQRVFIDQVVAKVDQGELPRAMVNVV
ncbi:MAG: hypothetical protein ABL921_24240, partial [Pirellula sp.]